MNEIWNKAIEIAKESLKNGDIPVGAIIVKDDKIIGSGYNTRELNNDVMGHAEINAIKEATKTLYNWNLFGSTMYVTLKPCSMCMEVIRQSRISKVYYLLDKPDTKKEFAQTDFDKYTDLTLESEYKEILSNFFKELREKK